MKLKKIYEEVVKKGIEGDPRDKREIARLLAERKRESKKLDEEKKRYFDPETLFNPFADTRIVHGDPGAEIRSVIVGIDVGGEELLLVDRLREKKIAIDLILSHHPQGRAYANFYEVMDLQVDMFVQQGMSVSFAESLLKERKTQVERKVGAANHQRCVDIARWLGIHLLCVHTPADNLAYRSIKMLLRSAKPRNLEEVVDMLLSVPEYSDAAKNNNPPKIFIGNARSKVSKVHIEFTGGTEGPQGIYEKLSNAGIDTIIAMHQSEEHFKRCKEANLNAVVAPHIASDTLGMNCMLDHLLSKGKLNIYEFSGFKRFSHKQHR